MRTALFSLMLILLASVSAAAHLLAQNDAAPVAAPSFAVVDVYIDSAQPLAAYQVDLTDATGRARIVGVEGGESEPFRAAPYYDPLAIQRDRVILAAFSTASANDLPRGKVRVATVHVRVTGEPRWNVKLVTAANASGEAIAAEVSVESGN